jgi:hypothetical protein
LPTVIPFTPFNHPSSTTLLVPKNPHHEISHDDSEDSIVINKRLNIDDIIKHKYKSGDSQADNFSRKAPSSKRSSIYEESNKKVKDDSFNFKFPKDTTRYPDLPKKVMEAEDSKKKPTRKDVLDPQKPSNKDKTPSKVPPSKEGAGPPIIVVPKIPVEDNSKKSGSLLDHYFNIPSMHKSIPVIDTSRSQFADDDSIGSYRPRPAEVRLPPNAFDRKTYIPDIQFIETGELPKYYKDYREYDNPRDRTPPISNSVYKMDSFVTRPFVSPSPVEKRTGKDLIRPSITTTGKRDIFCLSRDEKHAFLVSPEGHLFRVPLAILLTTTEYSAYLVARLPLSGPPTDLLDLGFCVAVAAAGNLVVVAADRWRLLLEHRLDGRETVALGYRMAARRLFAGRRASGEVSLAWWTQPTAVSSFAVDESGGRLVGRESLAVKGRLRPGITGDARCYVAVNWDKFFVLWCFCDDESQDMFFTPIELKKSSHKAYSPIHPKADFDSSYMPPGIHIPSTVSTLLSMKTPEMPSIRGVSLINEGFMLYQWSPKIGTTLELFTLKGSRAAFYKSYSLESLLTEVSFLDTIGTSFGQLRYGNHTTEKKKVWYGDTQYPDFEKLSDLRFNEAKFKTKVSRNTIPTQVRWFDNGISFFKVGDQVLRIDTVCMIPNVKKVFLCSEVDDPWKYDAINSVTLYGNNYLALRATFE